MFGTQAGNEPAAGQMFGDPGVTFGSAGLDRAAHLRGDAAGLAGLMADPRSCALALWRGKPLLAGNAAARLPLAHPAFSDTDPLLFLGLSDGAPVFARDLVDWLPEPDQAPDGAGFLDRTEQSHPLIAPPARFVELRAAMARLPGADAELVATAKGIFAWHAAHGFCAGCGAPSRMVMSGWQRLCPACGAAHFPRTDPVVIMRITRGNRVLIGRSPGWPEGMYSLLAGFMEPGETLEAAVRREVREEAGVRVGRVSYLASQPWPFPSSLMLGCAGEALDEAIRLDPAELEEALWLGREEMAEVFAGLHPKIRPPRRGAIAGHLLRRWLMDAAP
jgi:NAD+ diphosphatase